MLSNSQNKFCLEVFWFCLSNAIFASVQQGRWILALTLTYLTFSYLNRFPSDEETKKKWLKALGIREIPIEEDSSDIIHICSDHFIKNQDFIVYSGGKRSYLKKGAVPSVRSVLVSNSQSVVRNTCEFIILYFAILYYLLKYRMTFSEESREGVAWFFHAFSRQSRNYFGRNYCWSFVSAPLY